MADELINKHLDGQDVGILKRWLTTVTTPPTGAGIKQGMLPFFNPVTGKYEGSLDGTNLVSFATASDLAGAKPYRGQWDASTGIPTAAGSSVRPNEAIEAGDYWRVSAAGTITGMQGVDTLEVGDVIYANADGAATAASFYAVQSNIDPATSNTKHSTVSLAALPANTPTDVAPGAGVSVIHDYEIFNAAGQKVTDTFVTTLDNGTPKITIESLVAQANLQVRFLGE